MTSRLGAGLVSAARMVVAGSAALAAGAAFAAGDDNIGDIVVTATKSGSQRVLDTPASIQAIGGDTLVKQGSVGFLDVADKIPGLSIQDLGPGDRKYVIRGINSTGDSTVGVYYDEAVISGSNANDGGGFESDIRLYDLDRIEVLRGPQGTLYGATSLSGTIRFITKKPDLDSYGGYLTGELSGTSHADTVNYNFNGAANIPLIENVLGLRVVGWKVSDAGFIDQVRLGTVGHVSGINNDDVEGGRISLRLKPIENLTIDASFTDQSENADGSSRYTPAGVRSFGTDGAEVNNIPSVPGGDLINTDVTRSPSHDDLQVYSLTINYDTSFGTFTGTTNQYNRKLDFTFDSTPILVFFGVPVEAVTLEPQTRRVNSSEVRYASKFDFPVNFVIGGYRQYETNDLTVQVITANGNGEASGPFSSSNADDALSSPTGDTFFGRTDYRTTEQYAGFGEITWKVTPDLTVLGGVRYFSETLDGIQQQTHPFGGFPGGQPVEPISDTSQSYSKVTYKGNVSYKLDEGALVYGTISEGFRGGGLNGVDLPFEPIPASFEPDTVINYEVGAKGRLLDGKIDYQADVYLLRWDNIQVPETTADGAFTYQGNAGSARVKGVELELTTRPFPFFRASVAGSYEDAYLTNGATPAQKAANPTLGITGEDIPNVPKLQFNVTLDYTRPINDDWTAFGAVDINYRGHENSYFSTNPFNIPLSSYTLVNLRVGTYYGPWSAILFARNLTDERAQVSAINATQDPEALLTVRPRTVGITVTRTF